MRILIAISLVLISSLSYAEQQWVYVQLEKTPLVDRQGKMVGNPILHHKNPMKVTSGGEWVVPKELKKNPIERYQKNGMLLVLVDVNSGPLPGEIKTQADAELMKKTIFGVPEKEKSGVTK